MEEIKSSWDGWEKQFWCNDKAETQTSDGESYQRDVHHCAITFLKCKPEATAVRVGHYIMAQFPGAGPYWTDALVYANNVLKWTPEQFRALDRQLQLDAIVKPLVESAEAEWQSTT